MIVDDQHLSRVPASDRRGFRTRRLFLLRRRRGRRENGEPNDKLASLPESRAMRFDVPAVQLDDATREIQPESQSATTSRERILRLHERLEDASEVFARDADAVVANTDHRAFASP